MHLTLRRREGWVIGDTENRFASAIKAPAPLSASLRSQRHAGVFSATLSSLRYHPAPCLAVSSLSPQVVSTFLSVISFSIFFPSRPSLPAVPRSRRTNSGTQHSQSSLRHAFRSIGYRYRVSSKITADNWDRKKTASIKFPNITLRKVKTLKIEPNEFFM